MLEENCMPNFLDVSAIHSGMEKRCLACYNKNACSQCMYNLEGIDETPKCQGFMDKAAFRSYCESNMLLIRQSPSLYRKIMSEVISS